MYVPSGSTSAVLPPATSRRWNNAPLKSVNNTNAFRAPGVRSSRIITPAFDHSCAASNASTRTVNEPSPASAWYVKWNPSPSFHTSVPDAVTTSSSSSPADSPATDTTPMSVLLHGSPPTVSGTVGGTSGSVTVEHPPRTNVVTNASVSVHHKAAPPLRRGWREAFAVRVNGTVR